MELFRRFDAFNTFNCDEGTFKAWLIVVESHYWTANSYHNSTHAADVMQVMFNGDFNQKILPSPLPIRKNY